MVIVSNKLAHMFLVFLLEIKAQVDAMWEQMNKGVSNKILSSFTSKPKSPPKKTTKKTSSVRPCCCFLSVAVALFTIISLSLISFNLIILKTELDVFFGVGAKGN